MKTLYDAKAEKELARRDALLGELRSLHTAYSDDQVVVLLLGTALFAKLRTTPEQPLDSEGICRELRELHAKYPMNAGIAELVRDAADICASD